MSKLIAAILSPTKMQNGPYCPYGAKSIEIGQKPYPQRLKMGRNQLLPMEKLVQIFFTGRHTGLNFPKVANQVHPPLGGEGLVFSEIKNEQRLEYLVEFSGEETHLSYCRNYMFNRNIMILNQDILLYC